MTDILDRPTTAAATAYPAGSHTARARLVISALSLLAAAAAGAGFLVHLDGLRTVGMVGYAMFGAGAAPWAYARRLDLPLRLALGVGTSMSALVLLSTVMLKAGSWHPVAATAVLFAVTVPAHVAGIRLAAREGGWSWRTPGAGIGPAPAIAVVGALTCLATVLTHRHIDPGLWGFLVRVGPFWYVGLGLIVVSLAMSGSAGEAAMAVGVVALVIVLTGTPALLYDLPRSPSAAKHVELVEQIRHLHYLTSNVDVYNGWPSFFSAMAWLSDVAGIRDAINLATAWPVLIGLSRVVAMRYLAGQVLKEPRQIWLAVTFGVLADTIGQDYFSPQSLGFVLGLLAYGLALSRLPLRHKATAMTVVGLTMTVSHQLSPYIVGATLGVLVVFRRLRPWWMPLTVLVPAVLWSLTNWSDLSKYMNLGALGSTANLKPPAPGASSGLSRLPEFTDTQGALVVAVAVLGVLGLSVLARQRRDPLVWALAVSPAAGLVIVVLQPYGKEGVLRAALFGLPWMAILAAGAFRRGPSKPASLYRFGVIATLTTTFLLGTFSLDASNVMRQRDRQAFAQFVATNPGDGTNYALILGPGDLPSAPTVGPPTHMYLYRAQLDAAGFNLTQAAPAAIVHRLTRALIAWSHRRDPARHLYAVWSPESSYYGWEYGLHTPAQFAALRDAFSASPAWSVAYSGGGTVMFEYMGTS